LTITERKALQTVMGELELLRIAIIKRDPYGELEFRMRDVFVDLRGIYEGRAAMVAGRIVRKMS